MEIKCTNRRQERWRANRKAAESMSISTISLYQAKSRHHFRTTDRTVVKTTTPQINRRTRQQRVFKIAVVEPEEMEVMTVGGVLQEALSPALSAIATHQISYTPRRQSLFFQSDKRW